MKLEDVRDIVGVGFIMVFVVAIIIWVMAENDGPRCVEYTGELAGMEYNGEMWTTDDGYLIGFAREEDTRIWNHPACV